MNDKVSNYNIDIKHENEILFYNTLTDSLVNLTDEEFSEVKELMNNLQTFNNEYPILYQGFKDSGFIIDKDFDELGYIKLQNKLRVFEDNLYHLTINPTLDCNLTCWYCSTEYAKATHDGAMTEDTVNDVIEHIKNIIEVKKARAFHLDWFGGEPLMYFDKVIVPISKSANKLVAEHKVVFTQHITTNATLMDEKRIQSMKELNFTSFQIPIDGNERRHNQIKFLKGKEDTYKLIINNINLIADIIPNSHIILRINFDKQTLKHIKDVIKDISESAKDQIEVDFQRVWQVPFSEKETDLLKSTKEAFQLNGLKSNFWAYRPQTFFRCYADRYHHYAINYDGRVFKCTARDYGDDKVIGNLLHGGNIEWNKELQSAYFAKSTFENKKCLKCTMLPLCMGPCIQRNYDSVKENKTLPCNFEQAEYSLTSYIIEEAKKRKVIN